MVLFRPTMYKSISGNLYCLVFVDDYIRYTWVFFLQEKSKTMGILKKFAKRAQNLFGNPIVKIRSNNGTEFKNSHIDEYCDDHGIKHELSSTYKLEQNG